MVHSPRLRRASLIALLAGMVLLCGVLVGTFVGQSASRAAGGDTRTQPELPRTVGVECVGRSAVLDVSAVAAQPDGVHLNIADDRTAARITFTKVVGYSLTYMSRGREPVIALGPGAWHASCPA